MVVDGGTSGVATFGLARKLDRPPGTRARGSSRSWTRARSTWRPRTSSATSSRSPTTSATSTWRRPRRRRRRNADVVVGLEGAGLPHGRSRRVAVPRRGPARGRRQAGDGAPRPVPAHADHPRPRAAASTLRPGDIITHAFRGAAGVLDPRRQGHAGVQRRGRPRRAPRHRPLGHRLPLPPRAPAVRPGLPARHDLHRPQRVQRRRPGGSLAETISKVWALGVDAARRDRHGHVGDRPRSIGRIDELGTLAPGRTAEVSVLRIDEGTRCSPTASRPSPRRSGSCRSDACGRGSGSRPTPVSDARVIGARAPAQGGRPVPHRPRPVPGRPPRRRAPSRRAPAQPGRARGDPGHRHHCGVGAPGRRRRVHAGRPRRRRVPAHGPPARDAGHATAGVDGARVGPRALRGRTDRRGRRGEPRRRRGRAGADRARPGDAARGRRSRTALAPDAPLLYPEWGTQRVLHLEAGDPGPRRRHRRRPHVLRERFENHRIMALPLEGHGAQAEYDAASRAA